MQLREFWAEEVTIDTLDGVAGVLLLHLNETHYGCVTYSNFNLGALLEARRNYYAGWCQVLEDDVVVMEHFDATQQLVCHFSNLVLCEWPKDVGQHVQVFVSLSNELIHCVELTLLVLIYLPSAVHIY